MTETKWYLEGLPGQLLDEVTDVEAKRARAEMDAEFWAHRRDENIKRLMELAVPVKAILAATSLSRSRLYQIRDQ
jgi:hypothetical protein